MLLRLLRLSIIVFYLLSILTCLWVKTSLLLTSCLRKSKCMGYILINRLQSVVATTDNMLEDLTLMIHGEESETIKANAPPRKHLVPEFMLKMASSITGLKFEESSLKRVSST